MLQEKYFQKESFFQKKFYIIAGLVVLTQLFFISSAMLLSAKTLGGNDNAPNGKKFSISETIENLPLVEPIFSESLEPANEEPAPVEEIAEEPIVLVEEVPIAAVSDEPISAPELTTDKPDYSPGETVSIFGRFFNRLQNIILSIFGGSVEEGNYTEKTDTVKADKEGSFTYFYQLDNIFRPLYTVIASSLKGEELARTTFTDPVKISYDKGVYQTDQAKWTTGNAGSGYKEGDWAFYTYAINGIGDNPIPSFNVVFNHYQGSSNAVFVDAFTNFRYCWDCPALPDGTAHPPYPDTSVWKTWISANINYEYSGGACSAIDSELDGPAQFHCFRVNGTEFSIGAPSPFSSDHTLRIFFEAHLARSSDWIGGYESQLTVPGLHQILAPTEAVPATVYGAGVYSSWLGSYNGVGFATGSSRHFNLQDQSAGPSGAITLPIPTVPIPSGSITVVKDTVPDSEQNFEFTGSFNTFYLDDDADGTLPNSITFENLSPGVYSVAETQNPAYTTTSSCSDGSDPSAIDLAEGENITCTFVNTLNTGTIVIVKDTIPNDAQDFSYTTIGGLSPATFSLDDDADGTLSNTRTYSNVIAGSYSVTESAVSGFDLTDLTCVDPDQQTSVVGATANIDLDPNETITCTFTNTKKGTIVLVKNTIGGNGTFNFTTTGGDGLPPSPSVTTSGGTGSETYNNITPGSYSIAETVPAGWDLTSSNCSVGTPASFAVAPGATVTCTFENTKKPTLTVNKVLVPSSDNGLFNLQIDSVTHAANVGNGGTTGAVEVSIGSHTASEIAGTGTDLANYTTVIGGDCAADGSITLAAGDNKTCTITNTRKATIIVKKVMIGGTGTFSYTGNPAGDISTNNGTISESVVPGTYYSTEGAKTGWDLTSVVCDDGNSTGDVGARKATFNAEAGETVTCTFENTKLGRIIIVKDAIPNNAQDFEFSRSFGANFFLDDDSNATLPKQITFEDLASNIYTVTELAVSGWDLEDITCTDPTQNSSGDLGTRTATINLAPGEEVTCEFTNRKMGRIIVDKVTYPSADSQLFDFNLSGGPDALDVDFSLTDQDTPFDSGYIKTTPGNHYAVTEDVPTGWKLVNVVCSSDTPDDITLTSGQEVTCTFYNTKPDAKITLNPLDDTNAVDDQHEITATVMVNEGSGFAVAPDGTLVTFSFSVNTIGAVFVSGVNTCTTSGGSCSVFINSSSPGTVSVHAATDVTVLTIPLHRETDSSGENSGPATKTYVDAKIGLSPLEDTNNVNDPHTITATVMEDPGSGYLSASGELVTFSLSINTAGASFVGGVNTCSTDVSGQCSVQINTASPGSVDIHGSVDVNVSSLVLHRETDGTHGSSGDASKVYVAGKIIVEKVTVGGDSDFDFTTDYSQGFTLSNGESNTSDWLAPGTYSVSEAVPTGWNLTSATCDDGSDPSEIHLSPNETVSCLFTNTKLPRLGVKKILNPLDDPGMFELKIDGGTVGIGLAYSGTYYQTVSIGQHTVSETAVFGTNLDDYMTVIGGDCDEYGDITLAAGDEKICIIVNTKRGHIIVDKVTDPAQDPQSFSFDAQGGAYADFSLTDTDAPNDQKLVPGNYSVAEIVPAGWDLTSATCDDDDSSDPANLTLDPGETIHCTFNNQKDAFIIVEKQTLPDGDSQSFEFNPSYASNFFLTDGQQNNSGDLDPGTYSVAEIVPTGWDLTSAVCDDQSEPSSISLEAGETATCIFTNTERGLISGMKFEDKDGNGSFNGTDSGLENWEINLTGDDSATDMTDSNGDYLFDNLVPGTYHVCEAYIALDWVQTMPASGYACANGTYGYTIVLTAGEDNTGNDFGNYYPAQKMGIKYHDLNADGNRDEGEPVIEGWTMFVDYNDNGVLDGNEPSATTDSNGEYEITGITPGTWKIREQAQADWFCSEPATSDAFGCYYEEIFGSNDVVRDNNFGNYQKVQIIVEKQTLPDGSQVEFEFVPSYDSNFFLTDGQQNDSGLMMPGSYSVSEIVPTGWDLTSATCDNGDDPADITLESGDVVTCAFENTQRGKIIVDKVTDPAEDSQSFEFDPSWTTNFFLTDLATPHDSGWLTPGTYSVSEIVPTGWDLTSVMCGGALPDIPSAWYGPYTSGDPLTLDPGETITCTFTNTKLGKITIIKNAEPNDLKDFQFTGDLGTFYLDDDQGVAGIGEGGDIDQPQSEEFDNLSVYADYTVSEASYNYWQLKSIVCTEGAIVNVDLLARSVTITLSPGEEVTCTFTNEKLQPTRTQGFWKTHTNFTSSIFSTYFGGGMTIGDGSTHKGPVDTAAKIFGAYYSSIPKTSTGAKRSNVDKARIQLLHQLVTAKLNCAAFGCNATIQALIASADTAYAGTDVSQMLMYAGQLDDYNNSGDTMIISPPLPWPGSATPKLSKDYANIPFWDTP